MGNAVQNKPCFTGSYDVQMDGKHRVSVPYQLRAVLNADDHGRGYYVLPGPRKRTLSLYPDRYYRRLRGDDPPPEALSPEVRKILQFIRANTALLDPDAQGRILLPKKLVESSGIRKELTLAGAGDHIDIWDREAYEQFQTPFWESLEENQDRVLAEFAAYFERHESSGSAAPADTGL